LPKRISHPGAICIDEDDMLIPKSHF